MRKIWVILLSVFVSSSLSGCEQSQQEETQAETVVAVGINLQEEESSEDQTTETELPVNWENCKAVGELKEEAANGDITLTIRK